MSVTSIIGRKNLGTRRPIKSSRTSTGAGQATLGSSPTLASFRSLIERFARAGGRDIHRLRHDVVLHFRRARDPRPWVNVLIDECVNRGGPDGLVMAVEVLAQIDPRVILSVAWNFFRQDESRWRQLAKESHARYTVRDEVWHILLRSICQSADSRDALALLLVALAAGPDGIREGCAEAATDLAAREPRVRAIVKAGLNSLLEESPNGLQPVSRSSRRALLDALEGMGD